MPDAITILLTTIFVNNFVMVQFLGLCPFMGASNRLDSALGIAAATLFVMTLASSLSYLLNAWFLVPLEIEFLPSLQLWHESRHLIPISCPVAESEHV